MKKYGKILISEVPAETTQLLKLLCTDYHPSHSMYHPSHSMYHYTVAKSQYVPPKSQYVPLHSSQVTVCTTTQ